MFERIPRSIAKMTLTLFAVTAVSALAAGSASASVVFNNIPRPLPGNVVSQAFEATQTSEFGSQIELAGSARAKPVVTVAMSSWACQNLQSGASCHTGPRATFSYPITLNVYEVQANNEPGAKLASVTQTFAIPYRPSASKKCSLTSEGVVGWGPSCFSGKAFKIKFAPLGITLPTKAIVSIAYNTTDYGYAPTHAADVGEDSLNVGLYSPGEPVTSVGGNPQPEDDYINSQTASNYCGSGVAPGTFGLSGPCWEGYQADLKVTASGH